MKICQSCGALVSDNVPVCPRDGEASWNAIVLHRDVEPEVTHEAPPTPNVVAPMVESHVAARHNQRRGHR